MKLKQMCKVFTVITLLFGNALVVAVFRFIFVRWVRVLKDTLPQSSSTDNTEEGTASVVYFILYCVHLISALPG